MQLDAMNFRLANQVATAQQKVGHILDAVSDSSYIYQLDILAFCKQGTANFPQIVGNLRSDNPPLVLEALRAISKMLSIVEARRPRFCHTEGVIPCQVLDSILERQVFASGIVRVFELIVHYRVVADLTKKAQAMMLPEIQACCLLLLPPHPDVVSLVRGHALLELRRPRCVTPVGSLC